MQLESLRTGLLVEAMHPRNGQSRLSPGIQTLSAGQSLDLYMKQMAWTLPKRCLCVTIPAAESPIILEVKWDEYLPDIIRDAVNLKGRRAEAFSKYAACRMYG